MPQNVEHPGEVFDQCCAEEDEHGPENQRNNNAKEEYFLLVFAGHFKCGDDEDEHEKVVE